MEQSLTVKDYRGKASIYRIKLTARIKVKLTARTENRKKMLNTSITLRCFMHLDASFIITAIILSLIFDRFY